MIVVAPVAAAIGFLVAAAVGFAAGRAAAKSREVADLLEIRAYIVKIRDAVLELEIQK
jgi:L-cystine uptake protein TcyP (sodium:dicarboxylate symporter family)